jgi:hypothetical protein
MKQGTISVLFGCHSVIHSYWVWRAWHKLYNKWPLPRETVCIIIHDWGHWGTNYLNNEQEKADHWILGTRIALKLFGIRGAALVAGHTNASKYPQSKLLKPDKYSWLLAPEWWIKTNYLVEPKINCGIPLKVAAKKFKEAVKANIDSDSWEDTHAIYLKWKNIGNTSTELK